MSTSFIGSPSVIERLLTEIEQFAQHSKSIYGGLKVCWPGVIVSFDSTAGTVEVDLAIQEQITINDVVQDIQVARLPDVPLMLSGDESYTITFPDIIGSECLIIFGDVCMNAWFQNGAIQTIDGYIGQIQEKPRRHTFSDGFAILRPRSLPKKIENYSTTALEIRRNDNQVKISLTETDITIVAQNVNVQGSHVNVSATEQVTINGSGHVTIEGKDWLTHKHSAVQSGSGVSGPVL